VASPRPLSPSWFPSPATIAWGAGILAFLVRVPFLFRYDLHFGGDSATCYLMALRILQGDRPFYFYGQDYQGALEAYVAAFLFRLFGPSIPLAGALSLLEWSLAVACGTYLAIRGTTRGWGALAGFVAAVGVPYTLHYVTVPYWGYPAGLLVAMLLPLQAFFILERGPSPGRFFLFGLTLGLGWYAGKQCFPGVGAALLALVTLRSPTWSLRRALRIGPLAAVAIGFLVGYSPELWYRFHHDHRSFGGVADVGTMLKSGGAMVVGLPAYFDGQPIARAPEGIHFFIHFRAEMLVPADALDVLAWVIGSVVVVFAGASAWRAYRGNNAPLFLLGAILLVNIAAVIASQASGGDSWAPRRYLYSSAVVLSLWTGLLFAAGLHSGQRWLRVGALVLGIVFVGRAAYHQAAMLYAPDELSDIRWIIRDIREQGYDRGLAHWSNAYVVDALTDQDPLVAAFAGERIPEYSRIVAAAERLAVIELKSEPLEKEITFNEQTYRLDGPPREAQVFRWAPYRKAPK
jgi:hypothetical protein